MSKATFFSFCALTLKEGITELSLVKIGLISKFVHVMSKWAVVSFLADVKVEKTAWLGLVKIMIDLVVALLVL